MSAANLKPVDYVMLYMVTTAKGMEGGYSVRWSLLDANVELDIV